MGSAAPTFDPSNLKIEDRLFINGEFVPSKSGKKFDVINPASEKLAASVYEANVEDVDAAVAAAKAAFPAWSDLNAVERAGYLFKLADKMDQNMAELSYLDAISMGKPTYNDHFSAVATQMIRFFAGRALELLGDSSLNTKDMVNISFRQPYGVCGAIVSLFPTPTHSILTIQYRSPGTDPSS
jgi:aldehyde dehydrogenase (NAD+)